MSLLATGAALVAFLGYSAGAFGWYRTRRGDFITDEVRDHYNALQHLGPVIATFATAIAIALQSGGAP